VKYPRAISSFLNNSRPQWPRRSTCAAQLRYAYLMVILPSVAWGEIQTTTQTLSAIISPAGKLSIPGNVSLSSSSGQFASFSGNLLVSYWARTSDGGNGTVAVQASSEFSPPGGPLVASVTYYCTGATLGTGCSGTHTIHTTSQTSVVSIPGGVCTGGGGTCSGEEPNAVQLHFALPNKPHYKTGSYSVQLMFTISTL
jgi:hypothetical protein